MKARNGLTHGGLTWSGSIDAQALGNVAFEPVAYVSASFRMPLHAFVDSTGLRPVSLNATDKPETYFLGPVGRSEAACNWPGIPGTEGPVAAASHVECAR